MAPEGVGRMAAMRAEYSLAGLAEADLAADWVTQFDRWLRGRDRRRAARAERDGGGHGVADR